MAARDLAARRAPRLWKCYACRRQFTVLTGTPLAGSHVSPAAWLLAIATACKHGIDPDVVQILAGVTYKTACRMIETIRRALASPANHTASRPCTKRKMHAGLFLGHLTPAQAAAAMLGGCRINATNP